MTTTVHPPAPPSKTHPSAPAGVRNLEIHIRSAVAAKEFLALAAESGLGELLAEINDREPLEWEPSGAVSLAVRVPGGVDIPPAGVWASSLEGRTTSPLIEACVASAERGSGLLLKGRELADLHSLAQVFDEAARLEPVIGVASLRMPGGDRPGDLYNSDASITTTQAMVAMGWTLVYSRGAVDYLRRPGKDRGSSATVGHIAPGIARIFTTSTILEAKSYDKFGLFATWYHGGDFAAAGRELYASYPQYRTPQPEPLAPSRKPPPTAAGPEVEAPSQGTSDRSTLRVPDYSFTTPFAPEHFVSKFIGLASQSTDASHEYHEAVAVSLLCAAAGPNARLHIGPWMDRGLGANLFALIVGDSSTSRKSTSIQNGLRLGRDAMPADAVGPGAVMSDEWSPEAFQEQLEERDARPAIWAPDEFQGALDNIQNKKHMSGARGMLLTLYDSNPYSKARTKKRMGGEHVNDRVIITNPHLTIIGACTPTILDRLSSADVEDGLLPRFAIVWPETAPPRLEVGRASPQFADERESLVEHLQRLRSWSGRMGINAQVAISDDALAAWNRFDAAIEARGAPILSRYPAMALKVAIAAALGRSVPDTARIEIEMGDIEPATALVDRWAGSAVRFAAQIGGMTIEQRKFHSSVEQALAALTATQGGRLTQTELYRLVRRPTAREWREIAEYGNAAGLWAIESEPGSGTKPVTVWVLVT